MADGKKRKIETGINGDSIDKRSKQWGVSSKGRSNYIAPSIEAGDSGIWATCDKGREGKATAELRELLEDYVAKLYEGGSMTREVAGEDDDDDNAADDIEVEISKEVQGIKSGSKKKEALLQPVKVDIQCVLFFQTREPVESVALVQRICEDAFDGSVIRRHRWIKRLTPMVRMGKATEKGLHEVGRAVLDPVFHVEDGPSRKFAIRPTIRNHNVMKRDGIIKQIATAVGPRHTVDLKNYDLLILVDVYRVIAFIRIALPCLVQCADYYVCIAG